jgi:hypothetical protein
MMPNLRWIHWSSPFPIALLLASPPAEASFVLYPSLTSSPNFST